MINGNGTKRHSQAELKRDLKEQQYYNFCQGILSNTSRENSVVHVPDTCKCRFGVREYVDTFKTAGKQCNSYKL